VTADLVDVTLDPLQRVVEEMRAGAGCDEVVDRGGGQPAQGFRLLRTVGRVLSDSA
jgi:hypothetical protein